MRASNRMRGYSLVELLTVVAIIGVLSLVTVPAFLNYQRSAQVKNSMRQFATDLRSARQRAVSRTSFVRVTIPEAADIKDQRFYRIEESTDRGVTFVAVPQPDAALGLAPGTRALDKITWFTADSVITFRPNGTAQFPGGATTETITIDSDNRFGKSSFDITVSLSGKVATQ